MRYSSIGSFLALVLASGVAHPEPAGLSVKERAEHEFLAEMEGGEDRNGARILREAVSRLRGLDLDLEPLSNQNPDATGSLSDYETYIPSTAVQHVPPLERALLDTYLSNPDDAVLARILGAYHVHASRKERRGTTVAQVKHDIYASYFLSRAVDLGAGDRWIPRALADAESRLRRAGGPGLIPMIEEGLPSHLGFIDAFNYDEGNRHVAVDGLLREFIRQPNNLMTNAYLAASNIWVGGEAAYNDATMLYSFLLSSYFVVRAVQMAEVVENAWLEDPENNPQFRLSSILGGWAIPARRWLASIHRDTEAVRALDEEHRYWLAINRAFHSASIGLMMFDEPENLMEGFGAWMAGFEHCQEVPGVRSCIDRPKMTFNRLSFTLGGVDYFLKAGQLDLAQYFLSVRRDPALALDFGYEDWDLGREGWEHRENNLTAIAALYSNGDPGDDPTNFLLKSHKWGPNTIVCQTCHQTQSRVWSEEVIEQYRYEPAHEDVAVVGEWPAITTTWYGASLPALSR
ncbi:hypothetical protein SOCE26_056850 [Sorangium cellulosum]|uniref:Uncharacterized protein n=1 Tax=Sorangium cellulosum TaxID=56 RepID=A0A2L0EY29_SORCE|nr:hypothetical protein [Sorangium cellulosum]AUX44221.1 hypothetical protein SOCE26_056850 [Sorangium cellulosum]